MKWYVPLRLNSTDAVMFVSSIFVLGLAALLSLEVFTLSQQAKATVEPIFCSPSSLHNTAEPPETQLTRDYALIRLLLKNPKDQFEQIERVYDGTLHAPAAFSAPRSVLKRADRAKLIRPAYHTQGWSGSLRAEVSRIDAIRSTRLTGIIERGLQENDAPQIETGLRLFFAILLDELLAGVEQRMDSSVAVSRGVQHARRYYREALDAYLIINSPEHAARASAALEAMSEVSREAETSNASARASFIRERTNLMRAVRDGLARESPDNQVL
jgi:hypothetical protein